MSALAKTANLEVFKANSSNEDDCNDGESDEKTEADVGTGTEEVKINNIRLGRR